MSSDTQGAGSGAFNVVSVSDDDGDVMTMTVGNGTTHTKATRKGEKETNRHSNTAGAVFEAGAARYVRTAEGEDALLSVVSTRGAQSAQNKEKQHLGKTEQQEGEQGNNGLRREQRERQRRDTDVESMYNEGLSNQENVPKTPGQETFAGKGAKSTDGGRAAKWTPR